MTARHSPQVLLRLWALLGDLALRADPGAKNLFGAIVAAERPGDHGPAAAPGAGLDRGAGRDRRGKPGDLGRHGGYSNGFRERG